MIDSIVPIILIFLYITFMVLLNHYKSMNLKKKNINKELLKDNPVYLLYIYGNNKPNKLLGNQCTLDRKSTKKRACNKYSG